MSEPRVLIVGAGPTGLVLALELHRQGIPCCVIDKRSAPTNGSKALSINPSTLDLLNAFGVSERLLKRGVRVRRATVLCNDRRISSVDFRRIRDRNRFFLMLPQPATEAVLTEALTERGGVIERGTAAVGVQQTDEAVTVSMVDSSGRQREERFDYVVGCDGARSEIRHLLGLSFQGADHSLQLALGDVKIAWDRPRDEAFYVMGDDGFCIVLPLTNDRHRVVVTVDAQRGEPAVVTLATLQERLDACTRSGAVLSDPSWLSQAPIYTRIAAANRSRRVFLAGDAVHLFSPIGGYGMNTGIADAMSLGWRLAYVLRGFAAETCLQGYEVERMKVAREMVQQTEISTSLLRRGTLHSPALEAQWLPRMSNRRLLKALPYQLAGFTQSYNEVNPPTAGRVALPGCMVPIGERMPAWPHARGVHHLVCTAPRPSDHWPEALAGLRKEYGGMLQISTLSRHATDIAAPDGQLDCEYGRLVTRYGFPSHGMTLVRPDLYVETITDGKGSADAMARHLATHYRRDASGFSAWLDPLAGLLARTTTST